MKRGKSAGKQILVAVLLLALLVAPVPGNVQFAFAENIPEENGYITDVTGLEVWDKVWLKEPVTVTEDVLVVGEVNMEPGVSVKVTSGRLTVEGQAMVNGDIYIEKSGMGDISGTVNGTIYVNSTDSNVQVEDWDGSLVRGRNFVAQPSSVIDTIILNGVGTGYIDGKVETLKVDGGYNGDYGSEWNSVIQNFEYCGESDFYNCGHIYEAKITGGHNFSNNPGAVIDRVVVSDGSFNNNGQVYYAVVEKSGRLYNNNTQDTEFEESMIEHVVVKDTVEEIKIDGEIRHNLENYGNIGALIAYGGSIRTVGDINYCYADNCRNVSIDTEGSWRIDRGTDYQVEYLYAKNTVLFFNDWSDERTQMPKIRVARIENGQIGARDVLIEELYINGSFSELYLERAEIYDLYIAGLELTEQTYVEVPTPEEVVIADFKASEEAQDAYELVTSEMYERMSEEEQALIKEFVFETEELVTSEQEIEEKEFTKTLEQYDILTIEFSSCSAVGAVLVECPSGFEFMVMSKDNSVSESFMAYESGEYKFRVIGDDYGAGLNLDVTRSAKLGLTMYTRYATEQSSQEAENENALLKEFHISMYDMTENKEFSGFVADGEEIVFRENPKGHTFAVTFENATMPWEFEPETVEVTINEGETQELEVVVKQYGDYYGYTVDGTIPQVYFYDETGNFVRRADGDSYGNFWAGRLPSGEYTAILLRDDTGNYMFSHIDSFSEYGLVEKEDYLKDSFTMEAGLNIFYPEVALPEAPSVENIYFDNNLTSVNTNRQTTVAGELVQVTLNYTLKEEYADKVAGLLFKFNMCENTEFINGSVTVDGEIVSGCVLEDSCLVVPAEASSGTICYQILSSKTDVTLLTTANAEFVLNGKEVKQLIGMTSVYITALTASIQTVTGNGKIFVTGYTSPEETVTVLDNGTAIGEIRSNSSGYFSDELKLPENISRHNVCVAKNFDTSSEIRTEEYVVSALHSAPELLDFTMYYYVHGHSAKFHLTGKEFSTKRFIYDYWPGSVFTFELKMAGSEMIEELYVVSNKGSVKKLQAFYEEERDLWVASGVFSEDENYAPADFDIEYILKEIDIEKEIGDFHLWYDVSIEPQIIESIYEEAEKDFSEYVYDEENNSVSNTVTIAFGEEEYSCDFEMALNETKETKESLLSQGYEVETRDGVDYFYKFELDYDTWMLNASALVLFNDKTEVASAGELMLFSVANEDSFNGPVMLSQNICTNVKDIVTYQMAALPEVTWDSVVDGLAIGAEIGVEVSEIQDVFKPCTKKDGFLSDEKKEMIGDVIDAKEWFDAVTGQEHREAQQKYFDKLDELLRKLGQIEQARQEGKAGNCANIPLDSFYDDIMASYKAVGNLTNAKWSFDWVKKVITSAADYVAENGIVKKKLPNGTVKEMSVKEAMKLDKLSTDGLDKHGVVRNNFLNHFVVDKLNDELSVESLYEKGMDAMAGDTLEYWDRANKEHLKMLDENINLLLKIHGLEQQDNAAAGNSSMVLNSNAAVDLLRMSGNDGGGGCYDPKDMEPYPGGNIPGGGGDVHWDPSGYVYEGVPSNRLAGVVATTYYRAEDGSEVLWNAEEYGQINPQVTDSKGCYGWFVPEGDWKVVYTKDGYEIAETEWLPVPPPQTEVNIGLISKDAPELKNVVVSPGNAVITFSKYVEVETVTEQVLSVKTMSGKIEAVNAETGADGTILASKFRILFDNEAVTGKEYTVEVKAGIRGYNGLMVSAAELTATCAIHPESISVEVPDYLIAGEENTIQVTIIAEGGFESMNLECDVDEEFLEVVSVGKVSAEGMAELVVKAKKTGVSLLKIGVAGSDVILEQDVVAANEQDAAMMNYVEREKNQAAAVQVTVETADSPMVLWIVLIMVCILVLGAGIAVLCMKKRRKTA